MLTFSSNNPVIESHSSCIPRLWQKCQKYTKLTKATLSAEEIFFIAIVIFDTHFNISPTLCKSTIILNLSDFVNTAAKDNIETFKLQKKNVLYKVCWPTIMCSGYVGYYVTYFCVYDTYLICILCTLNVFWNKLVISDYRFGFLY